MAKQTLFSNGFIEPLSFVFGSFIYQYVTVAQTCWDMLMKMVISSFLSICKGFSKETGRLFPPKWTIGLIKHYLSSLHVMELNHKL